MSLDLSGFVVTRCLIVRAGPELSRRAYKVRPGRIANQSIKGRWARHEWVIRPHSW
jgi:hypothetical protein